MIASLRRPRLENWSIFMGGLIGDVYEHPTFPDGMTVVTSHLQDIDTEKGIARTQNTTYQLGQKYDIELEKMLEEKKNEQESSVPKA